MTTDNVHLPETEPLTATESAASTGAAFDSDCSWVFGRWTVARTIVWSLITICVVSSLAPSFFGWFRNQGGSIMDYYQEWSSVRSVILREPVYQPTRACAQRDFGNRLNPKSNWILGYNVHPPTSVLLALPFGYLSYSTSFFAWSVVTLGVYAFCLFLIARNSGYRFGWLSLMPITCGCLLCNPFWHQFRQGQLNPLILLFITLGWLSLRSQHRWRTGFWLGLAAATKAFPAFLAIFFVARREWKNLAALIAGFTLVTLITASTLGIQAYVDYVRLVLPEAIDWRSANTNASLAGLWCKLFDPGTRGGHYIPLVYSPILAKSLTILSWLVVLSLLVPVCNRAKTIPEIDHAFGLALVGMLLLSPITWDHYFLLLPLPLLCIWMRTPRTIVSQGLFLLILAGLFAPIYGAITVLISARQMERGLSPLDTLGLPSFSCYMLCGLFALGYRYRPHLSHA